MNKNSSPYQLDRVGERTSAGGFTDRLSNLPDFVIYHVLSFLDTKYAVQTSVLSRQWRCAWKHVPALTLHSNSFFRRQRFETFVDKVLSLRCENNVDAISYRDDDGELYERVIQYAFSHHTRHLCMDLDSDFEFSELFGSNHANCDLETLELTWISFDDVGHCCFEKLTTLKLKVCTLYSEQDYDFSWNLPLLMNLDIYDCYSEARVKFYAPQLRNLKLASYNKLDIEIAAPKLKFFRLKTTRREIPKFSVPYVDHAEIVVSAYDAREDMLASRINSSLSGLIGAKSLLLRCGTTEELKGICNFLERKPFCFTKLESLVCVSPYEVVNYQVEGSSSGEPSAKNFRRR